MPTVHDALHTAAATTTGLSDFGSKSEYLLGLNVLLQALDHDGPHFAAGGREFFFDSLVGVLASRLMSQRGFAVRPEALARPGVRPLIITGVPRAGTTALNKLFSVDDQFQARERGLTAFPMPRPPRKSWESNSSYRATVAGIEAFFSGAPNMRAANDMVAGEFDKCLEVLKQDFCSNNFGSTFRVPHYDEWWLAQDETAFYLRFSQVL